MGPGLPEDAIAIDAPLGHGACDRYARLAQSDSTNVSSAAQSTHLQIGMELTAEYA